MLINCHVFILFVIYLAVMHDLHLIHTDLKPENILLVSSEYIEIPDYKVYIFINLLK